MYLHVTEYNQRPIINNRHEILQQLLCYKLTPEHVADEDETNRYHIVIVTFEIFDLEKK